MKKLSPYRRSFLEVSFAFFLTAALIAVFIWSGVSVETQMPDVTDTEIDQCYCLDDCFYTAIAVETEGGEGRALTYDELNELYFRCEESCYGSD